jgi:ubiquitin carboxyl-terminal hydrolase 16/45
VTIFLDADVEDNIEQSSVLQGNSAMSSSEDSTVKGSIGPTSSDVSSSRTKVDTEQSEATSTCHSETTEGIGSQAEDVSALADGIQSMNLQEDSGIATDSNHKSADGVAQRSHKKLLHAKLQREARMKAMQSLSDRYHAVSQECSIMSCLNQFTAPELLTGNNKFGCAVCSKLKRKKQGEKGEQKE